MRFLLSIAFLLATLPAVGQNSLEDAYERGVRLERSHQWMEGREALLEAIAIRPEPGRNVVTGTGRVLPIYEPYLHLAHCELRLGMKEDAKRHFETARNSGLAGGPLLTDLERWLNEEGGALPPAPAGGPRGRDFPPPEPGMSPRADEQSQPPEPYRETEAPAYPTARQQPPQPEKTKQEDVKPTATPASEPAAMSIPPPEAAPQETTRETGSTGEPVLAGRNLLIAGMAVTIVFLTIAILKNRKQTQHARSDSAAEPAGKTGALTKTRVDPVSILNPDPDSSPTPTPPNFQEILDRCQPMQDGSIRQFGSYTLEAILGRGGMGTTYLARRMRDGMPVAIKIPHDHLLYNQEFVARFLREGALGSALHHPNIIRIFEAESIGKNSGIVMELLDGETLESKLKRERKIEPVTALEIARDIALALDYARLKGVVHRDLKPENIMILKKGGLKVMDFGIAKILGSPGLTTTERFMGTPTYGAPEPANRVDQQSDLYSLGIILFRLLTGDPPFRSTDVIEVLEMHRKTPLPPFPPDLEIPASIYPLVKKLAEKRKEDRYSDPEAFLVDLNQVLKHL